MDRDYEKAHKEALERAKKELKTCGSLDCDAARLIFRLFPQLAESEDERIRRDIVAAVEMYKDFSQGRKGEIYAWLEKQKEPLTPEEKMNHPLYLEGFDVGKRVGETLKAQKPAEWSEEEKLHYANVLEALEYVKGCKSDYDKIEAVKSDIAWLKSLRSQARWRPTEEQMKALLGAEGLSRASGYRENAKVLASLYEQLKKL